MSCLRILWPLLLVGVAACGSSASPERIRPRYDLGARMWASQQQLPPCPSYQTPSPTLAGLLQAPSGRLPLAGVPLSLTTPFGVPVASTGTDGCGRFQFANVAPGPYALRYGGRNLAGVMLFTAGGADSWVSSLPFPVPLPNLGPVATVLTAPIPQARAAVVPGAYDDLPGLLQKIGIPYVLYTADDLTRPAIYQHAVIFVACDGYRNPGADNAAPLLRNFVGMGGSLYATHNALPYVGKAFPEAVRYDMNNQGGVEVRMANVVDPGLLNALRGLPTVTLIYDTGGWGILEREQPLPTLPLLRDTETQQPTAVRFMYGLGSVRFSSFHKEPQMSPTQEAVLIYMISGM
jgi:hypothetical protein